MPAAQANDADFSTCRSPSLLARTSPAEPTGVSLRPAGDAETTQFNQPVPCSFTPTQHAQPGCNSDVRTSVPPQRFIAKEIRVDASGDAISELRFRCLS